MEPDIPCVQIHPKIPFEQEHNSPRAMISIQQGHINIQLLSYLYDELLIQSQRNLNNPLPYHLCDPVEFLCQKISSDFRAVEFPVVPPVGHPYMMVAVHVGHEMDVFHVWALLALGELVDGDVSEREEDHVRGLNYRKRL